MTQWKESIMDVYSTDERIVISAYYNSDNNEHDVIILDINEYAIEFDCVRSKRQLLVTKEELRKVTEMLTSVINNDTSKAEPEED